MSKPINTILTPKALRSQPAKQTPKPVTKSKEERGYLDGGCNPPPALRKIHCERP